MKVTFPGGKQVEALYKGFTVQTDQPVVSGGEGSAPSPFDLFLCSIGTCAEFYVLDFCQHRGIPYRDIQLNVAMRKNQNTGLIGKIKIGIKLPADFPDQYKEAVVKAAMVCTVKKHLAEPPEIEIEVV